MQTARRFLFAAAALAPLLWSTSSHAKAPCVQSGTPFQVAYAQQAALPGVVDTFTYDVTVHSYRFKPLATMTVCSIGYQSPPTPPLSYRFYVKDMTTNTVLLNTPQIPASNFPNCCGTSYVAVTPFTIVPTHVYMVRRTVPMGAYMNTSQLIGRLLTNQSFPIMAPQIKIVHSKLYGGGGPSVDQLLPFIDFGI